MQEKRNSWPYVAVNVKELENQYAKYLKHKYQEKIIDFTVESRTYYVSYAEKFVNIFNEECLLFAYYDEETGECGLQYASESKGFPYLD
jgi:hypothetical protein